MRIGIEFKKVAHIPVLDVYNLDSDGKAPIVIFLHGLDNCKELHVKEAYKLARLGFFVTLFDAHRHGELQDETFKNMSLYEKMANGKAIIQDTLQFIDTIIDEHCRTGMADSARIGLIGISMGAKIIYEYIATNMRFHIKAAVPLISSPLLGQSLQEFTKKDAEAAKYLSNDILDPFKQFDNQSYAHLLKLKDFPLLIQNGCNDILVPVELVRKCYIELQANYTDRNKIEFIGYPGIGHEVTIEMIDKACQWFLKYL